MASGRSFSLQYIKAWTNWHFLLKVVVKVFSSEIKLAKNTFRVVVHCTFSAEGKFRLKLRRSFSGRLVVPEIPVSPDVGDILLTSCPLAKATDGLVFCAMTVKWTEPIRKTVRSRLLGL